MAGQPTKYNEEMQRLADEYILNYSDSGDVIPSVAGLSLVLNVNRSTIYEWAKHGKHEEFSNTLQKLNATQENRLLNAGLKGDFNAAITKLALCNHGYSDKPEEKHSDDEKIKYVIVTDAKRD